jgi:uncharacterized membrane protein
MKKVLFPFVASVMLFTACKNESRDYVASESAIAEGIGAGALMHKELAVTEKKVVVPTERVVYVNSSSNEAKVTKKKGMSKAAKGAIIGGTAGAVTGGIITKSGKGAVVGGIIGAGTGYIIGRKQDKKDGRVQ